MLHIYLNSLYNLIYEYNPILLFFQQVKKDFRAIWNLRSNMVYAEQRMVHLEHQLHMVETYMNTPKNPINRHKFDVRR